jgi:hypothetical protein
MRLDLLRGFCVVVMVADHIGGEQSWLYVMTGGNRFFTSAAEGFVMRYGMVRLRAVEWKVRVSIVPTMLRADPLADRARGGRRRDQKQSQDRGRDACDDALPTHSFASSPA